jgi:hypothetical protein
MGYMILWRLCDINLNTLKADNGKEFARDCGPYEVKNARRQSEKCKPGTAIARWCMMTCSCARALIFCANN